MTHAEKAKALFENGCNCAQAVFLAFSDLTGMERETALKLSSSFGGGMGRMREVCGAVSGAFLVAGLLYGTTDASTGEEKAAHYARIRELAAAFREQHGSILCRDLLGIAPESDPAPSPRTKQYYQSRPCAALCYDAAEILDNYIDSHPIV